MRSLTILLLFFTQINFSQTMDFQIIPSPKKIEINKNISQVNFSSIKTFFIDHFNSQLEHGIFLLKNSLKNKSNAIETNDRDKADLIISFQVERILVDDKIDFKAELEVYKIKLVKNKIMISAPLNSGMFCGLMTLIQIIESSSNKKLNEFEIIDYPDFGWRGVSDDISRGQVSTIENFKRIIDHLARYKMNLYMPYLEDMLEFEKYPQIGEGRGALTKNEVKEIVEYASKNFIEVIPIFQTLGHYENILLRKEFLYVAEFPGAASLCVSCDETYVLLEELLKEVFDIFPSEYFHMGADESWDVGLGKSKHLVEQYGIAKVHAGHYKKVYDICKKYDKKVLMYGDIILDHPEILSMIPKDIIIVDWQYRANYVYPSTKIFNDAGFKYFVSPSVWNFMTTFPTNLNALGNIQYLTLEGKRNNAIGMVNSNWGDYGAETFKELVLYGYAWSAECSWNVSKADINQFNKNYFKDFTGDESNELKELYNLFSIPYNQIVWHDVWRHPLLPFKSPVWWEPNISPAARIISMESSLSIMKDKINSLRKGVKKNKDHIEILNFLLELNEWFILKVRTQYQLQQYNKDKSIVEKQILIELIMNNINQLKLLSEEYELIWKRYYKQENLSMVIDKFNRMIMYFTEIRELLENGISFSNNNYFPSPELKNEWLAIKIDEVSFAKEAEFKGEFFLDEIPNNAFIQLLADTHAEIFINNNFAGEIFARRSLSLYAEYFRVFYDDISKYLIKGKNEILIKVKNYNKNGAAAFNLTSSFDGQENIIDSYADSNNKINWYGSELNSNNWKKCISIKYPHIIIAPNFKTGRRSWIERI